jgi:hypothetical protein
MRLNARQKLFRNPFYVRVVESSSRETACLGDQELCHLFRMVLRMPFQSFYFRA